MKKLLGTLQVFADTSADRESSYTKHEEGTDSWEIVLKRSDIGSEFGTLLAHELGHFVASISRTNPVLASEIGPTAAENVAMEKVANGYAVKINPKVNRKQLANAFATYTKFAKEAKQHGAERIPIPMLRVMGVIR